MLWNALARLLVAITLGNGALAPGVAEAAAAQPHRAPEPCHHGHILHPAARATVSGPRQARRVTGTLHLRRYASVERGYCAASASFSLGH